MRHMLKTLPEYFDAVYDGSKTFEVRKNDRDFKVGDELVLRKWDPEKEKFTGGSISLRVTYILSQPAYVKEGYVIMGVH